MALPGAMAGVLWMLFITQTNISIPALMGAIMCIGVATSNAILVVQFANEEHEEKKLDAHDAALAGVVLREQRAPRSDGRPCLRCCRPRPFLQGSPTDPLASPLYAALHGLPPLLFLADTTELRHDDHPLRRTGA